MVRARHARAPRRPLRRRRRCRRLRRRQGRPAPLLPRSMARSSEVCVDADAASVAARASAPTRAARAAALSRSFLDLSRVLWTIFSGRVFVVTLVARFQ